LARSDARAAVITSEGGDPVGIVTPQDLSERILAVGREPQRPVHEVMSSPIVSIGDRALVYEALLRMEENGVDHILVRDVQERPLSVVRYGDLLRFQGYAATAITRRVQEADSVDSIAVVRQELKSALPALVDSGASAAVIMRLLTSVHDTVTTRLLQLAMDQLGPPPVRFAFVAMGSAGREEENLLTDQDNGIIYQDPDKNNTADVKEYFLALGRRVTHGLDQAGYPFCRGGLMADNPQWCAPLSEWRRHASRWISGAEPVDLVRFDMFFDFRCVYGATELVSDLRQFVLDEVAVRPEFLMHFARNAVSYRLPLGFFGTIRVRSAGVHANTIDMKEAMLPIIKFARTYALREQLHETNTIARLDKLTVLGILTESSRREAVTAYELLMGLRLKHQTTALVQGERPGNAIDPKLLTHIEEAALKESLSHVAAMQKRIGYDFLGVSEL